MALTTKESAHLLRIKQMYHLILARNGDLLYQDNGYKDFTAFGDMSEISSNVLKLEKDYTYYKENVAKVMKDFEGLDLKELESFDAELCYIITHYEIPLELKSVEEITDLVYGFPFKEYFDVQEHFSLIWVFLNDTQRHDLIAKYEEYTGWKIITNRSGFTCGLVYGLGKGLVQTVVALWDLLVLFYDFEKAWLGLLYDHAVDLRESLKEDAEWFENTGNIAKTIAKSISDDPGIIGEFFGAIWEMFTGFIDGTVADWMEKDPFDQGFSQGVTVGIGLFEIIIAVIGTKGIDKLAKVAKSGKFVALMEKMNLGRLNKLISKVDELKKIRSAASGISKIDNLALSATGKSRLVNSLTKFDDVDNVLIKLEKLNDDLPRIVDKITDPEDLSKFISKLDKLEAGKLDELTDILRHIDDYPNVTIDDVRVLGHDDLLIKVGKKSACGNDELVTYLRKYDGDKGTSYATEFSQNGKWPDDVQVPKNSSVLKANGNIDWNQVPNDGFVLDANGNAVKKNYIPHVDEVIDRYGSGNGRFTSPIIDGKPYSYDMRSLPYIEDVSKYHQYEVTGDFNNIEKYYIECQDELLKGDIDAYMRKFRLKFNDMKVQKGSIANGFDSPGGGIQYQLPLPVDILVDLKILKKIN